MKLDCLRRIFSRHARLTDDISYRPVDPEKDLDAAYQIFKKTISPSVMALNNGVWPEHERYPFFKKGFSEHGMYMLMHGRKPIGCFCITKLELPHIDEPVVAIKTQQDTDEINARPKYQAVILQRMYIEPDYQRHGIGTAIMKKALEKAHNEKLPLELEVLANNDNAIAGYEKNG